MMDGVCGDSVKVVVCLLWRDGLSGSGSGGSVAVGVMGETKSSPGLLLLATELLRWKGHWVVWIPPPLEVEKGRR